MKLVTLTLSLMILTNTVFAGEILRESSQPQISKQSNVPAWWTDRAGGLFGGIAGGVIGLMGGIIGTLAGIGIARKLCLFLHGVMFVIGVVSLAGGLAALIFSQPYAVYYPLLLLGFLCTILPATLFFSVKRRYEMRELRKMQAMDAK